MIFQQGALDVPQIPRFSSLFISSSQSKPAKDTGIYSVLTRQHAKNRCFETIFHNFSAHAPPCKKRSFLTLFLPLLIQTQEGIKSGQIAKLHLNSAFCLSQTLPGEAMWGPPCILPAKTPPPQLKLTCVSASGKTCPFAPTGGRIFFWCLCLCVLLVVSFYFGHCFSLRHKSCCKVDELLVESCVWPSLPSEIRMASVSKKIVIFYC